MLPSFNRIANFSLLFVAAIMLSLSTSGCASKYGEQTVKVNNYPQCYKPISDLRDDESEKTRNTVVGALVGGVVGGVGGYSSSGNAEGAIIGGVSGAIIGGTAAYLITEELQEKSKADRFAAYSMALDADLHNLQLAVAAAKVTSNCYEKEYKKLNTLFNSNQISKQEMQERLTELRAGTNDANTILSNFTAEIAENQLVYNDIKKREVARKSNSLSTKELQTINQKSAKLKSVNNEAQKMANILKKRTNIYSSRLEAITSTAHNQSAPIMMASMAPVQM